MNATRALTACARCSSEPTRFRARWVATWLAWATAFGTSQALSEPAAAPAGSVAAAPIATVDRLPVAPGSSPGSTSLSESLSTDPAVAEAREAFQSGIAFGKAGNWLSALQALERSAALHPHAITSYDIGYCELQLGHLTRARRMLVGALAEHRTRGAVELPSGLVSAAEAYVRDADLRLARVMVRLARGAVTVDGRPLELAENGGPYPVLMAGTRAIGRGEPPPSITFELLLDPGLHVFVVSTRGAADVTTSGTFAPGSRTTLELSVPGKTADVRGPERRREQPPNRMPAYIAFGIGAAGIGVGTASGLVAFARKDDVSRACSGSGSDASRCASEREAGHRAADIATVGFIGGGVAMVVGTFLFFTAQGKAAHSATTQLKMRPLLGWPRFGLEGSF